ncbi:MAG: rhodanese-like domain-containing protein [Actinomycetota bacterium]
MEPRDVPLDGSVQILDVRTRPEWDGGHVEGSKHIPLDELTARLGEIDKQPKTVVVCQIGQRSYMAAMYLRGLGIDAHNLDGGLERWMREGLNLVSPRGEGRNIDGMGGILEG